MKDLFSVFRVGTKKKDKDGNIIFKTMRKLTGTRVKCEVCGELLPNQARYHQRFCSKWCKNTLSKKGRKINARVIVTARMENRRVHV